MPPDSHNELRQLQRFALGTNKSLTLCLSRRSGTTSAFFRSPLLFQSRGGESLVSLDQARSGFRDPDNGPLLRQATSLIPFRRNVLGTTSEESARRNKKSEALYRGQAALLSYAGTDSHWRLLSKGAWAL